jgi:DNA repair exonuclease SbcCD ATPase subunit
MADQSIACPSCGKKIPLTKALRADIEASVRDDYDRRLQTELEQARTQAAAEAAKQAAGELVLLKNELAEQGEELKKARALELAMRKRERDLERQQEELDLTLERRLGDERNGLRRRRRRASSNSTG